MDVATTAEVAELPAAPRVRVLALDLNGHFTAAIALRHARRGPLLVVVNSTAIEYADKDQLTWAFDLLFPPPPGGSSVNGWVACEAPSAQAPPPSSDVSELVAMGFSEQDARHALELSNGSLAAAVDRLCALSS